jgi:hypothetical protein
VWPTMNDATRQQRRREMREQIKAGRALLGKGLSLQPKATEIIAVAMVVKAKLEEVGNPRRASEAAELAQTLVETSVNARPPTVQKIACAKGCAYCCHTFVAITPPEAFRLADAVRGGRAGGMSADVVRGRGAALVGVRPGERIGRKLACPLLVDGACSVYRHRPLACRQATSLDLAACVDEFEGRDLDARIPISGAYLNYASNAHVTLLGAMRAAGMSTESLELAGALDVALVMPDAEVRWLGGEDVFRDVQRPGAREAQTERAIQHVADALAG